MAAHLNHQPVNLIALAPRATARFRTCGILPVIAKRNEKSPDIAVGAFF